MSAPPPVTIHSGKSKLKTVFVGQKGIRAGWRFATFVVLLFGFSKLFFWLLTMLFHYQEHTGWFPADFLLDGTLSFGAALFAAWIMSKLERRHFWEYGLPWREMFGKRFWQGVLWGFVASIVMVILLRLLGAASFDGLALHGQAFFNSAVLWTAAFLLLGFAEEFVYRGYSQTTLADGMGFWPAAILLSAIFGAVHYFFKPMENWMDGLSVGLFGLFWCFTLRRTGTLWFAIGFHAMSDFADMVLFAQPNTGNNGHTLTGHLLNISYHGPEWLTGGPRGTEASALEFPILAALFIVFAVAYPKMKAQSSAADQRTSDIFRREVEECHTANSTIRARYLGQARRGISQRVTSFVSRLVFPTGSERLMAARFVYRVVKVTAP